MKEHRKFTMEQDGKRVTLEHGIEDTISTTPQWDQLTSSAKEGTAKYATIFGGSFMRSLLPAFLLIVGFLIIIFLVCGGI